MTASGNDPVAQGSALTAALSSQDRATLHLAGFAPPKEVALRAYLDIPIPPDPPTFTTVW